MAIAALIRKQWPGAYDDLTDEELEQKAAKAPGAVRLKIARAQMEERGTASAMKSANRGLDDPSSPEFQALKDKAELRGQAEAAKYIPTILGTPLAAQGVAMALGTRGIGAAVGGAEGYRKGGVPGAVIGATAGALKPGLTGTAAGAMQGYEAGGLKGAALGAILGVALGGGKQAVAGELAGLRGSAQAAVRAAAPEAAAAKAATSEVAAAKTALPTADELGAKILDWKTKQGFSGAQMVSSLKNVYGISPAEGRKMVSMVLEANGLTAKAAAAAELQSALKAPRVQVGAQAVGKELSLSKEAVREMTGPVVGEARGAASPVFPQKAFDEIYDKMLAMPRVGPERAAYSAAAKGEKAMSQVETIRRVFERFGVVLPIAAISAAVKRREES